MSCRNDDRGDEVRYLAGRLVSSKLRRFCRHRIILARADSGGCAATSDLSVNCQLARNVSLANACDQHSRRAVVVGRGMYLVRLAVKLDKVVTMHIGFRRRRRESWLVLSE